MQQKYRKAVPVRIDNLENRVLFSTIDPASYGASVNDGKDDRAAIQAAINASKTGDVIQFRAGEYTINGSLTVSSGDTLEGAPSLGTKLTFNTSNTGYAIALNNDLSGATIDGFTIRANCGVIAGNSRTTNVHITNNDFSWGYNGTNGNRFGIRILSGSSGLVIEHNNFHDSLTTDRCVDLSDLTNTSYSYNSFYKVNDGGHIDGTVHNFKFVGNVGQQIHRMGLEFQDNYGGPDDTILISDNVFTNWYQPFGWSFGLSIMPQSGTNVTIQNNYISATNQVGGWGDSEQKFGIGLEAGFSSGTISGNTFGGPWLGSVIVSMRNTPLKNNSSYGKQMWTAWANEGGINGPGSISDQGGNKVDFNINDMPAAPKGSAGTTGGTGTGGSGGGGSGDGGSGGGGGGTGDGGTGGGGGGNTSTPVYLSDLKWTSATNGWGPTELDRSNGEQGAGDGHTISLRGKTYAKGLGVHASSTITYNLNGKYTNFFSNVGIDDETGGGGLMDFQVWGDGVLLFDSGTVSGNSAAKIANVKITGVKQLKLVAASANGSINDDHGDWADAKLS